jgi:hypothetical protein
MWGVPHAQKEKGRAFKICLSTPRLYTPGGPLHSALLLLLLHDAYPLTVHWLYPLTYSHILPARPQVGHRAVRQREMPAVPNHLRDIAQSG